MGTPAYNLVIVRGTKEELDTFEKLAYKTESEAICFDQLLPLPGYLVKEEEMSDEVQAFNHIIYGSKWVGAFGISIEKSDSLLKYYFNSKYTKAQLDYIAIKYRNLNFTHVFVELDPVEKCGVIEYENGWRIFDSIIKDENMDWQITSSIHTYLYIEELFHKFMLVKQFKPEIFKELTSYGSEQKLDFFTILNRINYLDENESFYDSLYLMERDLETRNLDYARNGTYYPFRTNPPLLQLQFIEQNFLSTGKKLQYCLSLINGIKDNKDIRDDAKLAAYIYIHQQLAMEELLIPIVKEFIHSSIEKIKLHLEQHDPTSIKNKKDWPDFIDITPLFQTEYMRKDFQDWPGLEEEQASFHEFLGKAIAHRAAHEPRDYETDDLSFLKYDE